MIINYIFSLYEKFVNTTNKYVYFIIITIVFIFGAIVLWKPSKKNTKVTNESSETSKLSNKNELNSYFFEQKFEDYSNFLIRLKNTDKASFKKIKEKAFIYYSILGIQFKKDSNDDEITVNIKNK